MLSQRLVLGRGLGAGWWDGDSFPFYPVSAVCVTWLEAVE